MSGPLHVAMVSRRVHPAHGPGGMERHVCDLVMELAALGVDVDLYTEQPDTPARARAAEGMWGPGVSPHWVRRGWLPVGRRKGTVVIDRITNYFIWSARVAGHIRADNRASRRVVHAHGLGGWGVARARRRGHLDDPLVSTMHGLEEFRSHLWLKRWAYVPFRRGIRAVVRNSTAVVTTDRALQPVVAEHLGVSPSDQVVIPNAVHPDRCRSAGRRERGLEILASLGLAGSSPVWLSVGRLEANKGLPVLIEALGRAAPRLQPTWAWVLVGDGPEREVVDRAVGTSGIARQVRLVGRLPERDLHSLMAVATWLVHPTLYEGSSLVALEAMAHGLPIVASRTGGLPDKVEDGRTGFLAIPGDADDLAEKLVVASRSDARSLGDAGRRRCETEFSWTAVRHRYVELYERVLAR